MEPAAIYVTTPVTAAPPGPARVKVAALMVEGLIASLKTALRAWLVGTPVGLIVGHGVDHRGRSSGGAGLKPPDVIAGQRGTGWDSWLRW